MGEKILIVEDDKMFLEALKFKLENEGYKVEEAVNAWEALSFIERNKIDLIISDIIMPNMSGLSLLNVLNEFYQNKIPVIMMSSLNQNNIMMSAIGLGARDFMVKPVDFNELCKKIMLLLNKKNFNE